MKSRILFLMVMIAVFSSCGHKDNATGPEGGPTDDDGVYSQVAAIHGPAEAIASLAVSPDGRILAYGTYADHFIRLVDIATTNEIRKLSGHVTAVTELAFSPDGQFLASTGTVNLGDPGDGTVRVWDVAGGTQLAVVQTAPSGTSQLQFSPLGTALGGASGGGNTLSVVLWEPTTLNVIRTLTGVFRMISFNPDGSRIATGKRDDQVYIMDTVTGTEITHFGGHTGWIQSVAFSPDGHLLATGGEDRIIQIRDAQTGDTTRTLRGHTSYPDYLAFSPDMSRLASLGSGMNVIRSGGGISFTLGDADKKVRLWDIATGAQLPQLNTESDAVSEVAFNSDWSVLITGSNSGYIRIFQ
jgi:WD40 repeat protein